MHEYRFQAKNQAGTSKPGLFPAKNGERAGNLLRGREALPAQPEKPFSARAGGPGRGGGCTNSSEVRSDIKMM